MQFLRPDITAEEASNTVIEEMEEDDEHTWKTVLLVGWGDVWVHGHFGDVTDADRENVTNKAETKEDGCHICDNEPGTTTGKYIPDHQPPKVLAMVAMLDPSDFIHIAFHVQIYKVVLLVSTSEE